MMSEGEVTESDVSASSRLLGMEDDTAPVFTVVVGEEAEAVMRNGSSLHLSPSGNSLTTPRSRSSRSSIVVDRPIFTQPEFDDGFQASTRPSKTLQERRAQWRASCACSATCVKQFLYSVLPCIRVVKDYNVRGDLLPDFISGLMVGIMNIPQGMAYSILAGLEPVYGLYVSFFPVLLYFIFGTSRHCAIGTFAIMSLIVSKTVDATDCSFPGAVTTASPMTTMGLDMFNHTGAPPVSDEAVEYEKACKLGAALSLTFVSGAIQLGMGLLQLGFVSIYLSEPLTRGFTCGAAFHVFTSQVSTVLGITVDRFSGPGKLILTYIDLFKNITEVVWGAVIISVICLIILYVVKEFLNPIVKKRIKAPIPIELFVVIAATLASTYGNFADDFDVPIVGEIPTGIKTPNLPPVDKMNVVGDAFVLAIVGFAISVAQAELFAKKHGYEIDNNQEMIAYGICNFVTSFFNCFFSAASLSRGLVQDNTGGRTQVASLFSCVLVLIVLFFIGPLFKDLPMCVLASIIIIALKNAFLQLKDLKMLWPISKVDFGIWFITWISTVLLDIDWGLMVGVVFSLLTVIARTQMAYTCVLGQVPDTDIYRDISVYKKVEEIPGIKIFRFEASLYFANRKQFLNKLYSKCDVDPGKLKIAQQKAVKKEREVPQAPVQFIIIDCTTMGYMDSVAVSTMKTLVSDFKAVDVRVYLAGCKAGVRDMLVASGFYDKIDKGILFPAVHDAVLAALESQHDHNEKELVLEIKPTQKASEYTQL